MLEPDRQIAQADANEIERLLDLVLHRYAELFPDRELSLIFLSKTADPKEQLDQMIAFLQKLKTISPGDQRSPLQ